MTISCHERVKGRHTPIPLVRAQKCRVHEHTRGVNTDQCLTIPDGHTSRGTFGLVTGGNQTCTLQFATFVRVPDEALRAQAHPRAQKIPLPSSHTFTGVGGRRHLGDGVG